MKPQTRNEIPQLLRDLKQEVGQLGLLSSYLSDLKPTSKKQARTWRDISGIEGELTHLLGHLEQELKRQGVSTDYIPDDNDEIPF